MHCPYRRTHLGKTAVFKNIQRSTGFATFGINDNVEADGEVLLVRRATYAGRSRRLGVTVSLAQAGRVTTWRGGQEYHADPRGGLGDQHEQKQHYGIQSLVDLKI